VAVFCTKNVFSYKLKIIKKDLILLCHTLYDNFVNLKSNLSEDTLVAYLQMEQHIKNHLYSFSLQYCILLRSCVLCKRPSFPPWWNEKCQLAINERKDATRKYLVHPSLANFIAYKCVRSSVVRKSLKNRKD